MIDHDLLKVCEAARLVRRTPPTIIRWILHRGLAAVRVQGRYLVSRKALMAMMQQAAGTGCPRPGLVTAPMTQADFDSMKRHGLIPKDATYPYSFPGSKNA